MASTTNGLNKSVHNAALLVDRVPVPFMELDRKGQILWTNRECAELLNVSPKTLSGQSVFRFVATADIKRLRKHLAMARQTNKPCNLNISMIQRGKYFPVELRVRRQLIGSDVEYLAVLDDLDRFRNINGFGNSTHHQAPVSLRDLFVSLSRADSLSSMAEILGAYCHKAFRSPASMIFLERDGELHLAAQWQCRHSRVKYLRPEVMKRGPVARAFRRGDLVFWKESAPRVAFLPISTPGRPPLGVLEIVLPVSNETSSVPRDQLLLFSPIVSGCITRMRAYDEAHAARIQAESTIRTKDEFLSTLSHELKNSMMPILGWAVALSSGTLGADKQNLALEGIVRNVRSLNYLIEDLYDAARIASGKLHLQPSEIRIQDVAREALTAIQSTVEVKKLRVATDISEAIPPFLADSRRLHQVLMNLLNNAVKFTPTGGSISLQVRRRGDSIECVVSDTGKGIERKFLPFVFERFRQENRHSRTHAVGLGLGLTIVREIVELHGGSIEAQSGGMDKGATFIVRLPMRRRYHRSGTQSRSAADSRSEARKKISDHRE